MDSQCGKWEGTCEEPEGLGGELPRRALPWEGAESWAEGQGVVLPHLEEIIAAPGESGNWS